jgi:Golgi phosphoprotein 3
MASAGGLTRRRGGGGGAATCEDDNQVDRTASPTPKAGPSTERAPETSYTGGGNGHKIAFDPRDISESEERNKQPKLTLMEEILLMGLKDKQVEAVSPFPRYCADLHCLGLSLILER